MTSNSRTFNNPFAVPSKKVNHSKPASTPISPSKQNASKSLEMFMNFNPTLSKPVRPTTNQSLYRQHYYNNNNEQNHFTRKRTFQSMSSSSYEPNTIEHRKKRRKYPNDGGLTDAQMEKILEARKKENKNEVERYLEQRKRNFPTKSNVEKKREIIATKRRRGQTLSITEKIMNFSDRTGNQKTPSSLRFLDTPRFSENIVRRVLKKEIDQEYSAILQCFRYFIKTDFLTKELSDNEDEDDLNVDELNGNEIVNGMDIDNLYDDIEEDENTENAVNTKLSTGLPFDLRDIERDEALLDQEEEEDEDLDDVFNEILARVPQKQVKCVLTSSSGVGVSRR